jgi:hypothetical protein
MRYTLLPPALHKIADSAEEIIKNRYRLPKAQIETPIDANIPWTPTLHWKTKTEYIACEVSERPFPSIFNQVFGEITANGLPIRIIIAYPIEHTLSPKDWQTEINKAKKYGIGLLTADENKNGQIDYQGVSVSLHIPSPDLSKFKNNIQKEVRHAYEIYMNSDPKHGVQELGQIIENVFINLAVQAKKKGKLVTGDFQDKAKHYAQGKLIDDMIKDKIIDVAFLRKCRAYADDRNNVSHKPKSIKEAILLEKNLRGAFQTGLFILENFPEKLRAAGYKFTP